MLQGGEGRRRELCIEDGVGGHVDFDGGMGSVLGTSAVAMIAVLFISLHWESLGFLFCLLCEGNVQNYGAIGQAEMRGQ
jgi:hypothetical protein